MIGRGRGRKSGYSSRGVGDNRNMRLGIRRVEGSAHGLRLVHSVRRDGRRRLELWLRYRLRRIKGGWWLLVRHVASLKHCAVLAVLLSHVIVLSIGVGGIVVLGHVRVIHIVGEVGLLWLLVVMLLLVVLWLRPATMLSTWLNWRGHRHRTRPSVRTWSAGHIICRLTPIACTSLHGWLPSRQAVGHLAGLGVDESQWRSLPGTNHNDNKLSSKTMRRVCWTGRKGCPGARFGRYRRFCKTRKTYLGLGDAHREGGRGPWVWLSLTLAGTNRLALNHRRYRFGGKKRDFTLIQRSNAADVSQRGEESGELAKKSGCRLGEDDVVVCGCVELVGLGRTCTG